MRDPLENQLLGFLENYYFLVTFSNFLASNDKQLAENCSGKRSTCISVRIIRWALEFIYARLVRKSNLPIDAVCECMHILFGLESWFWVGTLPLSKYSAALGGS